MATMYSATRPPMLGGVMVNGTLLKLALATTQTPLIPLHAYQAALYNALHTYSLFTTTIHNRKSASAGNQTRVTSMATMYSATRPPMLEMVCLRRIHRRL